MIAPMAAYFTPTPERSESAQRLVVRSQRTMAQMTREMHADAS